MALPIPSIQNLLPSLQDLINLQVPQLKIDQTKPVSFANLQFTFQNDAASPAANQVASTLIHQINHPYSYTPAFLTMYLTSGIRLPGQDTYATNGTLLGQSVSSGLPVSGAYFFITSDDTFVNFWVQKDWNGTGSPVDIAGVIVTCRLYVFVDSLDQPNS